MLISGRGCRRSFSEWLDYQWWRIALPGTTVACLHMDRLINTSSLQFWVQLYFWILTFLQFRVRSRVSKFLELIFGFWFPIWQTGSGKTHTMLGDIADLDFQPSDNRGMTPRVFESLFAKIQVVLTHYYLNLKAYSLALKIARFSPLN